jgi:hypothetical protein
VSEHHDLSPVRSFLQQKVLALPTEKDFETMVNEKNREKCETYCAKDKGTEETCKPMGDDGKLLEKAEAGEQHTLFCWHVCEKECGEVKQEELAGTEEKGVTPEASWQGEDTDLLEEKDHRYCGTLCAERPTDSKKPVEEDSNRGCLPLIDGEPVDDDKVTSYPGHEGLFVYCTATCEPGDCKQVDHPPGGGEARKVERDPNAERLHAEERQATPTHEVVKDDLVPPTKVEEGDHHQGVVKESQPAEKATGAARGCHIDATSPDEALKQVQDCAKKDIQPKVQALHEESKRSAEHNSHYVAKVIEAHNILSDIKEGKLQKAFEASQQHARDALTEQADGIGKSLDDWASTQSHHEQHLPPVKKN